MVSSRSQRNPEIAIVSVGHYTESYPNTYYKARMLMDRYGSDALPIILNLTNSNSTSGLRNLQAAIVLKFALNNFRAWLTIVRKRPKKLYVCYPGIMLAYLCGLIPKRLRPSLYLDAFISIYDTVVTDRKIIAPESLAAKVLFQIERTAYLVCEKVIVDTAENANYMASFFAIPEDKLHVVNLTAPDMAQSPEATDKQRYTCLFIGTFVPLQGVECIAQAAHILRHRKDIHFTIIGSGQDSPLLRSAIENNAAKNISWYEQWQSTAQLEQEIASADVCLGIFGTTEKAERVWPFKNYLYMAAGKPVITGDTIHARELARLTDTDDFVTSALGSPHALADAITTLLASARLRAELGRNARDFHSTHLSHKVALRKLARLLDVDSA
jgi:glycosyltransferase involved in cell wall biosynthesis